MKRYLIQLTALSILALATGCQKEEGEINNPQNNQSAAVNVLIDGLPIDATTSRAVIEDMPNFETNMFTIAGYYTFGNADASTSGLFDDNVAKAAPNVFDYQGEILGSNGKSVIKPEVKEGKYTVTLSKWQLRENSYLSYFAWASNVKGGANPIQSATVHNDKGAPFIKVLSGTPSASYNVDVVAAKSANHPNDVVRSSIDLNFKHIMTKLKFNVKNISSADMTLTKAKILFAEGNVSRGATYSFDGNRSPLGTWGTYTDNTAATYAVTSTPINLASKAAAVNFEELLIIPQALVAGAISVELTYTIAGAAYTRTVPLKARTVEQNTSYTYEIALNETTISINEGRIGAWIDISTGDLPYIAGARDPNVPLLLDGYDPPYTHTDGNKYWLDRSGWNRHCKLVGSGTTYDAAEKCYSLAGSGSYYIEVPALPSTTAATFDIITRSRRPDGQTAEQKLFNFLSSSGQRVMWTLFSDNGGTTLIWDAGQTTSNWYTRVNGNPPLDLYKVFALYSFSKNSTSQAIYRNLIYQLTERNAGQGDHCTIDLSTATTRRIGETFKGDIKYIKVSNVAKPKITKTEYADLAKRHKVPASDYVVGYVKDALVLDLQGVNAPVDGLWRDLSGSGAHAKLVGNVTYDPVNKEYQTRNGGYLEIQLPASFKANGYLNSHTLEIVYSVPQINGSFPADRHNHVMGTGINCGGGGDRVLFFHSGYGSGYGVNYQSPINTAISKTPNNTNWIATKQSYYAARSNNPTEDYLEVRINNNYTMHGTFTSKLYVGQLQRLTIGEHPMNISAVRLYTVQTYYKSNAKNVNIDSRTYGTPVAANPEN